MFVLCDTTSVRSSGFPPPPKKNCMCLTRCNQVTKFWPMR